MAVPRKKRRIQRKRDERKMRKMRKEEEEEEAWVAACVIGLPSTPPVAGP